jgi:hypothetical protein
MTKVIPFYELPRAKNQSQAQEHPAQKFAAEPPHASNIPPGTAELLKWAAKSEEISQANTILDTIQIRRDNSEENRERERRELREKWLKNAKMKHSQSVFMYDMVEFYHAKNDTKWARKFTRTLHCRHAYQITHDGQALTMRCENRWCNYCSGVRALERRNRYAKVLSELDDVWFVTLTGVAVKPGEERLKERLIIYKKVWSKLIGKYKKRWQRQGNKGDRIRGLRALEVEISNNSKTFGYFHPHFHIITQGTEGFMQEFIIDWMYELGRNGIKASVKAQKAVRAKRDDDGNIQMAELTKYVTKSLLQDPQTGELKHVSEAAFAEIWEAVQGIRLLHPIDIKGELLDDDEEDGDSDCPTTTQAPPVQPGYYPWNGSDWVKYGIYATGYEYMPLTGHDAPITHKHCAEVPDWLKEQQNAASRAISKSANRLLSKGVNVPLAVYEELPEPEPEPDTKKEGEP